VTAGDEARPDPFAPDGWELAFLRSPLGMVVTVDGFVAQVNAALVALLDRPAEELVGLHALELIQGHLLADGIQEAAEAYERGDRRFHLTGTIRVGNDASRWVAIDAVIVDEATATAMATVTDLTDLQQARLDLSASERRFRSLLTNLSETISLLTADAEVIYSTDHTAILGHPETFWAGRSALDIVHPDDVADVADAWAAMLATPGEQSSREVRMQRVDGGWEDVSVTAVNLLGDPDVAGVVVTTEEVTAQRRAERIASGQATVLEQIARGRSLTEVAEACVTFIEANGIDGRSAVYLLADDRMEVAAGRTPPELDAFMREPIRTTDRSLCDLAMATGEAVILATLKDAPIADALRAVAERTGIAAAWSQPIQSIATREPVGSLCTVFSRDHEPTEHELQVADAACSLMAIAIERHDNEARLAFQAGHDVLTGLPNRAYLLERMDHALGSSSAAARSMALLFCDIDRLKVVNDSLGHRVGDHLLVAFAERLLAAAGPHGTVARFGGDEFVVLLEDLDGSGAPSVVADRIVAQLEHPFVLEDGQEVFLTVSVGLAQGEGHTTGEAWLRDADAAMYRAKERGGDQLARFDATMRRAALVRMQVENDLRRAIDRNELVVHHQPVVDLHTGQIVGAEALVRWQHPDHGLLLPDAFIPVAEDTGMIDAIGRHVLDLALGDATWLRRHLAASGGRMAGSFQLGVNVSARQLATPGLDAEVADACERWDWPKNDLLLEITESALLHRFDGPVDALTRIGDLGVELAIDDFGTGYSSLTRLGQMPVTYVKIDRTFVAAIDVSDSPLVRIVDAVIALAGALDLRVTAEGVETQHQLDYLRLLDCELAQGFLFSRALPITQFAALLQADPHW
jgi:diguanylate cyclase (GGDEF)-like protein/PAS domain S-box-containing protein